MSDLPIPLIFSIAFIAVLVSIEGGLRIGRRLGAGRPGDTEKESPASAISGAVLSLAAFVLSLTFSSVADRFEARKELVRQEANVIGTAFLRADFLPAPQREQTVGLLRRYVDGRLQAAAVRDPAQLAALVDESAALQDELWRIAVAYARDDPHRQLASLYVQSLNEVFDVHSTRVAVAVQARMMNEVWIALGVLVCLGTATVGYVAAVSGSRRSRLEPVLAAAFGLVFALIGALDSHSSTLLTVSQQPMIDVRASMARGAPPGPAR
jgi:hypothetical protein